MSNLPTPSQPSARVYVPQADAAAHSERLRLYYEDGHCEEIVGVYRGAWWMMGECYVAIQNAHVAEDHEKQPSLVYDEVRLVNPLALICLADTHEVLWNPRDRYDVLRERSPRLAGALDHYPQWPALLEIQTHADGKSYVL